MVNCLIIKNQDCVKCIPQYRRHPLLSLTGTNVLDDDSSLFGGAQQSANKAERFQKVEKTTIRKFFELEIGTVSWWWIVRGGGGETEDKKQCERKHEKIIQNR